MQLHEASKKCLLNEGVNKSVDILEDIENALERVDGLINRSSGYRNPNIESLLSRAYFSLREVAEILDS